MAAELVYEGDTLLHL